jgi:hypothetical protein
MIVMKIKLLGGLITALAISHVAIAEEVKEGTPKTGMFMYANAINVKDETFSLPVLKSDDLICTTYIYSSEVKGDKVEATFAQYCDPIVEEPIKLEDGSEATVISSASASTFYFDIKNGKHKFTPSKNKADLAKVHHVKMSDPVYQSFSKGFGDKVKQFITQRDEALSSMKKESK